GAPVYYYAGVLGWGLGAWAVVLTVALPGLARRLRQGGPEQAAIAFLARASAGILLFFTICASKRPAYILPAVVPLGLLAAAGIVAEEARIAAAVRGLGALAALAGLAAVGVGLMRLLPESRVLVALTPVVLGRAGIVLLAWGGVALVAAAVRPALAAATCALLAPAMGLVLLATLTWRRLVPVYADRRSILLRAEG